MRSPFLSVGSGRSDGDAEVVERNMEEDSGGCGS